MPKSKKDKETVMIICEKPAAAQKIATALGKPEKKNLGGVAYYELERDGKRILVGCAVGHLFSLKQVSGKGWPVFDIAWEPNFKVKKKDWSKKYYTALQKLCREADSFIIACDYDVEGEVIGWNVLRFICKKENAKRMKFSTLTASELQESYKNVLPEIDFGQAYAGETRHKMDWLYGINLSRALMEAIKKTGSFKILSIGRVQGPALHLVVEKEKSILNFKPEPFWQVFLLVKNGKEVEVKFPKDITKKSELAKFKILKDKEATALTTKTQEQINPPAPFDLTTLQTEAYKFHNFSPSRTLQIAQQLYLAGLISYPRTSSQKLPPSIQYKEIMKKLSKKYSRLAGFAKNTKPIEGKKSDPAHPSVYPTGEYKELIGEEKKIYELIVKRFISCFSNPSILEDKKIEVTVDSLKFIAKGIQIKEKGWMNVYPAKIQEKELPDLNGKVSITEIRIEEKMTQPPKRYTSASLVRELEKRDLGTKCLTGDTKVIFNGELIKIEDLFKIGGKVSKKKGLEIAKIQGKTISLDKSLMPKITSPLLISKRNLREKERILSIETDNACPKLTADHVVYVWRNNKIVEVKAEDLTLNDYLISVIKKSEEGKTLIHKGYFKNKFKIKNNEICHKFSKKTSRGIKICKLPVRWSTELAWILGYYYGDGSYSNPKYNGSHQLYFTTTEKKALKLLKQNIRDVFGVEPYCYNLKGRYKVNCNCSVSYALIKAFPQLEGKKPFSIPKKFIGDFLRGVFDADGNVHLRPLKKTKIKGVECNSFDTPRIKITLARNDLIKWVSSLLLELGIENHINKNTALCNGKKFDCWTIFISGRDKAEKFAYLIGFDSYKEDILYKGLKCSSPKYKILSDCATTFLLLNKQSLIFEELAKKLDISIYNSHLILKRLFKLGLVMKKRHGKNVWVFSAKPSKNYFNYAMKIVYKKAKKDIYLVPVKSICEIPYDSYVYDVSVDEDSPNFVIEGNILVHNSTRSSIIETLFDRGYVKGKSIEATKLGISLVDSLEKHSPIIIDEKLTRDFERQMESIQISKKQLKEKSEKIIKDAERTLRDIEKQFRKKEDEIGQELMASVNHIRNKEREENTLTVCPKCGKGNLRIMYNKASRRYFIACSAYPECRNTYTLPPYGLMKASYVEVNGEKINEKCQECGFPLMLAVKKGKRPWKFCFNPECKSRQNNNNTNPEQ